MMTGQVHGAGVGLRRSMLDEVLAQQPKSIDFFEIAPENWMTLGGRFQQQFEQLIAEYPFACHGLSLSIGSPDPLDIDFVKQIKAFLDRYQIDIYSEHLSFCSGNGHLYDLMPIPFTDESVNYVAERIRQVEQIIERPLIIENVSYYTAPGQVLAEIDFINAVLGEANCQLLLDVNNIYVNAVNHGYDAVAFMQALPTERIAYLHMAGHYHEADDLIVDTHGAPVIDPVWQLLEATYAHHGIFPTLLERDFNIPPLVELIDEVMQIKKCQRIGEVA